MNTRMFTEAQELMAAAEAVRQRALSAGTVEASEALQAEFEDAFSEAQYAVREAAAAEED